MTLCAECGMVSDLVREGGGKITAFLCVNGNGDLTIPCGRCRQLLWEHGTPDTEVNLPRGIMPLSEVLPYGFGPNDLDKVRGKRMTEAFDAVDIIRTKRDREVLSTDQINWVIDAYTRGVVAEEQMSALAMAIFLNGMNQDEISTWTQAMINSGETMDFSSLSKPTTDKHSTGGVGDKITLPLAPLVASYGVAVPQLSGRGLGHTGGTLDKLEAIPGWRANLTNDEILRQLDTVGAVICAAGSGLAPADRKALRPARHHLHSRNDPAYCGRRSCQRRSQKEPTPSFLTSRSAPVPS